MRLRKGHLLVLVAVLVAFFFLSLAASSGPFTGTDEKVGEVVAKLAREAGVGEREPFFNTDRGDLLLFFFAVSGLVAGFYLGYQWRGLFGDGGDGRSGVRR